MDDLVRVRVSIAGVQVSSGEDVLMGWLAGGDLLVVETDDDWFLGSVEVTSDGVVVRSGFVGRPTVLALEEILRIAPVSEYEVDDL